MLCRPPRPRWPPSRPRHDGYQNEFPVYHSRDSKRPCLPPNRPGYHIRPSFHPYNSHDFSKDHIPRRGAGTPLRYQNQAQSLHSQGLHSSRLPMPRYSDKHQDLEIQNCDDYQLENSGYQQNFRDPYTINEGEGMEYDNNFKVTETEGLTLVSSNQNYADEKSFGGWVPSSSQPVVRNKELDDWVPASIKTRVATGLEEDTEVTADEYEQWRINQGAAMLGTSIKKKIPKGMFSAAGKHPIGALKEKIPTCEFAEEARERNEELKFWKMTASVKFTGYKFLGYGVTIKIAKTEAAIKALTFLDVEGISEMKDHVTDTYLNKQRLLESVIQEEREEYKIEEPWYIKVGDDQEELNVPVFKPKEQPTPDTHPAMFLNQWYGPDIQTEYDIENPGFRPQIFSCTITVQGQAFQGSGPSKKEAQKITSALVLRKLEENPPPVCRKNVPSKNKKNKKNKKAKLITGVADMPSLPKPSQMPTVDSRPEDNVAPPTANNISTITPASIDKTPKAASKTVTPHKNNNNFDNVLHSNDRKLIKTEPGEQTISSVTEPSQPSEPPTTKSISNTFNATATDRPFNNSHCPGVPRRLTNLQNGSQVQKRMDTSYGSGHQKQRRGYQDSGHSTQQGLYQESSYQSQDMGYQSSQSGYQNSSGYSHPTFPNNTGFNDGYNQRYQSYTDHQYPVQYSSMSSNTRIPPPPPPPS